MASDNQFVKHEAYYKKYAYEVLESHFKNREEFKCFYDSLNKPATKDEFLRVTTFYRFLVKKGDWHVEVKDVEVKDVGEVPVIDYITNSFKVIALFAIIESLSGVRCQPHGEAKRRCVNFFCNLSPNRKKALCHAIEIDGKPLGSIEAVADFLYRRRSEFVHEARPIRELHDFLPVSSRKEKEMDREAGMSGTRLSINELMEAFEEGVLNYFKQGMSRGE